MVSDEQVPLVTWYLGITSLCSIKGLFNSYVLLRLQQIPRFPPLSSSHTFSKIHMHTCIHVYVHVFTVPHTVVKRTRIHASWARGTDVDSISSGEDGVVSSKQLSQDGRASVLQTTDGIVDSLSLSVRGKSLQKCWFLLNDATLPFEVPDLPLQPVSPSTWSSFDVNVGHVRKHDAGSPQTFQGIADYIVFNLHQAIYLWFFTPKYSVVNILMICVCNMWVMEFCLSITCLFVFLQDCLLWETVVL